MTTRYENGVPQPLGERPVEQQPPDPIELLRIEAKMLDIEIESLLSRPLNGDPEGELRRAHMLNNLQDRKALLVSRSGRLLRTQVTGNANTS